MKRQYLFLLLSLLALPTMAQIKLDAHSAVTMAHMRTALNAKRSAAPVGQNVASPEISVMVQMKPSHAPSEISFEGAEVKAVRDEFAVVTLPFDSLQRLSDVPGVKTISYTMEAHPCLEKANEDTGADKVHAGTDLNQPYTGKGVAVAVLDSWFDPNHPMFRDPATGKSRVKMFITPSGKVLDTPEQMEAYNPGEEVFDHGTHVTGIAAGAYDDGTFTCRGVATGSDILMAESTNESADFMLLVEKLVSYSKEHHEPLVINMSYKTVGGAHDGSNPIAAYIDRVSEAGDAVFCLAAGNEALYPCAQHMIFAEEGQEMKAILEEYEGTAFEVWSITGEPFDTKVVIVDTIAKQVVYTLPVVENESTSYSSETDAELAKYVTGNFEVMGVVDSSSSKYYVFIGISYGMQVNDRSRYALGYIVTGHKGQEVLANSFMTPHFVSGGMEGWGEGATTGGTANDFGSGTESIVVGSYTTKDRSVFGDGTSYTLKSEYDLDDVCGDVSSFSSYGTFSTGRSYPHILAPGCLIESSLNTFYMENPDVEHMPYSHSVVVDGRTYYWMETYGTSMSSPYMVGTAALWLEADPTLTAREIRDIAMTTARRDSFIVNAKIPVQCGAGKLDVYAGLKKVLERVAASMKHIDADKRLVWRATTGGYEFFSAGATSLSAAVYNMRGEVVMRSRAAGDSLVLSTADLPHGVYAVSLSDGSTVHTVKIAQ